jgi:protein phosphatase
VARRTAARTDTGRIREGNEDRYLVRDDRDVTLMAVADGVGGGPGGEVAASAAVDELASRFFGAPREQALAERLGDAIRDANTAVLRAADSSGNTTAASTLVAAAVTSGQAVIANLGDSRAYLVRDGASRQVTEDHSGIPSHGITRFVGDPRGVQADVYMEELRPGDRLVLCSDGLTRHVEPEEIALVIGTSGDDVDSAAQRLVELANSRGGEDNVTVIVHAAASFARAATGRRRAVSLALFVALVLLVVSGALAVLFAVAPAQPPSITASPSASATASPSPLPSPSPTPSESPTPTASP